MQMELEAVRPDSGGGEELRLLVSSQPMRLRIDQDVIIFLQSFFTLEANDSPSESVAREDSAVEETGLVRSSESFTKKHLPPPPLLW